MPGDALAKNDRPESLGLLAAALQRFEARAAEKVDALRQEAERAAARLLEQIEEVEQAIAALEASLCYSSDDDYDDSWAIREEIARQEALLARLRQQLSRLEQARSDHDGEAQRLLGFLDFSVPRATSFLHSLLDSLQEYGAMQMEGLTGVPSSSSRLHTPATGAHATENLLDHRLPPAFHWVPVDRVAPGEIPDELEFVKAPKEELIAGYSVLEREVLPALQRDPRRGRDFFVELDRSNGDADPGPITRAYDGFFGSDPIFLQDAPGGGCSVSSGRHRIQVARELGWTHVPVRKARTAP